MREVKTYSANIAGREMTIETGKLAEQASGIARTTEVERAREVWRRKFRVAPKTREERAKQMRFLRSRGFSFDAIRAVLGRPGED